MYIHEATYESREKNCAMSRPDYYDCVIVPTNTRECCFVSKPGKQCPAPRWEPTAEDLIANDWFLVEDVSAEGLIDRFRESIRAREEALTFEKARKKREDLVGMIVSIFVSMVTSVLVARWVLAH